MERDEVREERRRKKMNIICPECGCEKVPEEWGYKYCSDCRDEIDSDDDWFK